MTGEGQPPEWFNNKTFKTVSEQARAYNEARKQITEYAGKLKSFSGSPESYETEDSNQGNAFVTVLKEVGKKIGLNQDGFDELLGVYNETKKLETEKEHNNLQKAQKEELKKIGGITKLKELQTRFIDVFGDDGIGWLKTVLKSHDDYINLDRMVSHAAGKRTSLPVNSTGDWSAISTKEQAEALIRDPRWGKDKEFTQKVDKSFRQLLQR